MVYYSGDLLRLVEELMHRFFIFCKIKNRIPAHIENWDDRIKCYPIVCLIFLSVDVISVLNMSSFTNDSEKPIFLPLTRNSSLHSLSNMSSIWTPISKPISNPISKPTSQTLYSQLIDALMENADDGESYDGVVKRGNIILDMDGTLGDNIPEHFGENPLRYTNHVPIPRPGLRKFLRFVFAHYERVSIWTAALPVWYTRFKTEILLPNMPPDAEFHFERTRIPGNTYIVLKPLSEIYAKYPEYNEGNTTIVDDNAKTFKENMANAVHIPSFFYDMFGESPAVRKMYAANDKELFKIIELLRIPFRTST